MYSDFSRIWPIFGKSPYVFWKVKWHFLKSVTIYSKKIHFSKIINQGMGLFDSSLKWLFQNLSKIGDTTWILKYTTTFQHNKFWENIKLLFRKFTNVWRDTKYYFKMKCFLEICQNLRNQKIFWKKISFLNN